MTPKIPHSPFTTYLSGNGKETKLRINNIFQWKKKRPPVIILIVAVLLILFCGSLIGFKPDYTLIPDGTEVMEAVSFSDTLIYAEGKESQTYFDLYRAVEGQEPDLFCHYSTWGHPNLRLKALQLGAHNYLLVSYVSRYPDVPFFRYKRFTDIYYLRNNGVPLFTLQIQGNYSLKDVTGDGVEEIVYRQTGHSFDSGVYAAGEDGGLYQIDADGNYIFDQSETVDPEINLNIWYGIRSAPTLVRLNEGTDLWINEDTYSVYQAEQETTD